MVVPGELFPVEYRPPEAHAEYCPGQDRAEKPDGGRAPSDRRSRGVDDPQAPGAHTQGLTSMGPEPAKENQTD